MAYYGDLARKRMQNVSKHAIRQLVAKPEDKITTGESIYLGLAGGLGVMSLALLELADSVRRVNATLREGQGSLYRQEYEDITQEQRELNQEGADQIMGELVE